MRVLVLGGTGFLGRRVMDALARKPWVDAVAAGRHVVRDLPSIACDATDSGSVHDALRGAELVVNCVSGSGRTMVKATENILTAAAHHRVARVVHVSSMAVYDAHGGLVDEDTPLVPPGRGYAGAKVQAEALVADYVDAGGSAVVLRPSCIYGPGSEQWTGRVGRLLRAGRLGDLGEAGEGICNLIHVDDVAAAVVTALHRDGVAGERFNVSSPEMLSWNAYLERFAQSIGLNHTGQVSGGRLLLESLLLAPLVRAKARIARRAVPTDVISPDFLRGLSRRMRLDHRRADARLRFRRTRLEDGLRSAAAWFRSTEDMPVPDPDPILKGTGRPQRSRPVPFPVRPPCG